MEILITTITFLLLIGLILSPIVLLKLINKSNVKFKFITYLTVGLILTVIFALIFAWWTYTSDLILLKYYGYNIDGMNETEFYEKVSTQNTDKVKSLETSIMGIGWSLKAILIFVFYFPFLLFVSLVST